MSNNGDKENPELKSNTPPDNTPQEVLRVDLVGTKMVPKINSNYIPMLCFAIELLRVEVQKLIISSQIANAQQGIIIPPNPQKRHNIIDFLRGQK